MFLFKYFFSNVIFEWAVYRFVHFCFSTRFAFVVRSFVHFGFDFYLEAFQSFFSHFIFSPVNFCWSFCAFELASSDNAKFCVSNFLVLLFLFRKIFWQFRYGGYGGPGRYYTSQPPAGAASSVYGTAPVANAAAPVAPPPPYGSGYPPATSTEQYSSYSTTQPPSYGTLIEYII